MEKSMIAEEIRGFLERNFPAIKNASNEESLLQNGVIDSLGILEVVTFLEKEFGVSISDEELLPENFDSVRTLSGFVQSKRNGLAKA